MQPSRSQLETYRGWSPAWLASWLPFDIAFSPPPLPHLHCPPPPSSFPHSLFFRGVSFLLAEFLVARDESGGYLLSIDRFWQHAKSFWPSLRGLTSPFICPFFSLLLPFSPFFHFSHLFHAVLISSSIPNRPAITSPASFLPLSFWCRSLCRHALCLTDAFLFFPRLSPLSLYSLPSCNFVSRVFCTLYSHSQNASLLSAPGRVRLSNSDFCRRNQPWEFIRLTYYNLNNCRTRENVKLSIFFW